MSPDRLRRQPGRPTSEERDKAEKTTYAPGEPTWADLSSPDTEASRAFYGALLGWECTEAHR